MESIEHPKPDNDLEKINELALKVQPALALHVFHSRHPEVEIDELDPRNNSSEIRTQAMTEWLGDGKSISDSQKFRELINTKEFLADIDPEKIESIFKAYDAANTVH